MAIKLLGLFLPSQQNIYGICDSSTAVFLRIFINF
jgi:hypothetical protein